VCHYFGERGGINHMHYRNVKVRKPYEQYTELFLDGGKSSGQTLRETGVLGPRPLLWEVHSSTERLGRPSIDAPGRSGPFVVYRRDLASHAHRAGPPPPDLFRRTRP
jgi:hypothetical protein